MCVLSVILASGVPAAGAATEHSRTSSITNRGTGYGSYGDSSVVYRDNPPRTKQLMGRVPRTEPTEPTEREELEAEAHTVDQRDYEDIIVVDEDRIVVFDEEERC